MQFQLRLAESNVFIRLCLSRSVSLSFLFITMQEQDWFLAELWWILLYELVHIKAIVILC